MSEYADDLKEIARGIVDRIDDADVFQLNDSIKSIELVVKIDRAHLIFGKKVLEVETQPKKKIKKKKQYRTRSGLPVEIITAKYDHLDYRYSVQYKVDGYRYLCNKYGNHLVVSLEDHPLDLIEVTIDSLELDDVIEVTWLDGDVAKRHANGNGGFFSHGKSSETDEWNCDSMNQLTSYIIKSWKFISKFKQEENK